MSESIWAANTVAKRARFRDADENAAFEMACRDRCKASRNFIQVRATRQGTSGGSGHCTGGEQDGIV